jgi:serine-aspartate repeat-containing protein C/D/E
MTAGQCDGYVSSCVKTTCTPTATPTCNPSTGPLSTGTISGYVFYDAYFDGELDDNSRIPGVTVSLIRGELIIDTDVTDSNGSYDFTGLPAGTYNIIMTVPDNYVNTTPSIVTVVLPTGGDRTVNFGVAFDMSASGTAKIKGICYDANGNQSDRLPNQVVNLYDSNNIRIKTDTTNHNGYFEFPDLPAGTYYVSVDISDSLVDGSNYRQVVLSAGETVGLAFGIFLLL